MTHEPHFLRNRRPWPHNKIIGVSSLSCISSHDAHASIGYYYYF